MSDSKLKIDFLNGAISDTQELIRFIDTKLSVAITIIGALLIVLLSMVDRIISYSSYYSPWLWSCLIVFSLLLIICVVVTIRIIVPVSDPNKNIDFGNVSAPELKFYLSKNKYDSRLFCFYNSHKHALDESLETYLKILDASDESVIVNTLACEKFKLNYIRNIKGDRLRWLTYCLIVTTLIFIVSYITFSIETHNAVEKIAYNSSHAIKKSTITNLPVLRPGVASDSSHSHTGNHR